VIVAKIPYCGKLQGNETYAFTVTNETCAFTVILFCLKLWLCLLIQCRNVHAHR